MVPPNPKCLVEWYKRWWWSLTPTDIAMTWRTEPTLTPAHAYSCVSVCVSLRYRTRWIAMECILSIWALRTPLTLMVCCSSTAMLWVNPNTHTHDPTRTQYELACIQMQMQLTNLRCTLGIYSLMQRAFSFNIQGSVQPLTCRCAPPTQRRYENIWSLAVV